MAQLKDTIVSGNLRVTDTTLTDTLQVTKIKAPTTSGGTTYGPGTSGQVLKSNGTTTYWASDSNTDEKVNVILATTSKAYLLGTTTTPTGTAAGVTSVADTGVYLGTTAGSLYATSFYENGTSLASKYAAIGHTHATTIAANSGTNQLTLAASTKYKLTAGETNFIFTTPPNTTYSAGTGLSLSGTTFNHSNSVTAVTIYNKPYVKYDAQGHITGSSYWTATAAGTSDESGWIKVATMVHTDTHDDTPIMLLVSQRGSTITYKLHIVWKNTSNTDPDINKFRLSSDIDTNADAYIKKSTTSTWELYIKKLDNWDAIAMHLYVGKYFPDHMTWTWQDVQTAESAITGGIEAEKIVPYNYYQSRTANTVLAAPDGSDGTALFRKLVANDLPDSYLSTSGGTVSGTLVLSKTQDASGTANNSPALIVGGAATSTHLELDANEIMAKTNGTSTAALYINNDGGNVYINNNLAARHTATPTSGQVVIADGTGGGIKSSGYTIAKSVPSNAKFTDENVLQSDTSSTSDFRPILLGTTHTTTVADLSATVTGQAYVSSNIFVKPNTGIICAEEFSTLSYINGTGAHLEQYGLYLKSYKAAGLPAGGNYSCKRYVIRTYDGKSVNNGGMLLTIDTGGLTIVGGGESASSLADLISDDQRDSNTSRTRLDIGGTLNTDYHGASEYLILSSDKSMFFLTNCDTIADRKPVVLDTASRFYPGTTETGSIGASSYQWNTIYGKTIYENGTSLASKYAAIGHTHGLLHSDLNQASTNGTTGGWSVIGIDPTVAGYVLKSIRVNTTSPNWLSGDFGAGIAFGGSDTKGVISMRYQYPVITFAGGNHNSSKTEPTWYLKISGTSGSTYNLANFYDSTISRTANTVLAAPDGSDGGATFRKLVPADIPDCYVPKTSEGVSSSWWNDRDNAVIRLTKADSSYRPLWSLLTSTTGSWAVGNHNNDDLIFDFISKATYDTKANPASNAYKQVKFTNAGGITTTGAITASDTGTFRTNDFGTQLVVERTTAGKMASVTFKNPSGVLGHIAANTVDGDLYHYGATDTSTMKYVILDSHNYTSYPLPRNIKHIHKANGTDGSGGWVKIARITVTEAYADQPMTFTIAQRRIMQYRIHLLFTNSGSAAATAISEFIITRDNSWTDTNNDPRAYIIKPSDGIFDLYIRKTVSWDCIFVVDYTKADENGGANYSITWENVQTAESAITGGTEAVKKLYLPTTTNYAGSSSAGGAATHVATCVATTDGARPVFYAYLGDNTRVVYNTNFTYNPSGNVLTATTFTGNTFKAGKANTTDGEIIFYNSGGSGVTTLKASAKSTSGTYLLPERGNLQYTLSCGHEDLSAATGSLSAANVVVPSYTKFIKIVFKSDSNPILYSMVEIPYFGNGDYSALVQVGTYGDGQNGSPRIVMKAVIINITDGTQTGKKSFTVTASPTTKINGSNISNYTRNITIHKIYATD